MSSQYRVPVGDPTTSRILVLQVQHIEFGLIDDVFEIESMNPTARKMQAVGFMRSTRQS